MSRTDTWMPFYIADYLADTSHLNTSQHGAYILLLLHHWRNGPLPDDDMQLAAITRCDVSVWRKSIAPIVRRFFDVTDAGLTQKRLLAEQEFAEELTDKRAAAGKAGAAKRWGKGGKRPAKPSGNGGESGSGNDGKPNTDAMANGMANASRSQSQTALQVDTPIPTHSSLRSEITKPPSLRDVPPSKAMTEIPDWMPVEAWNGFVSMRKSSRKPFTPRAAELIVAKLTKFHERGLDVEEALNQSVEAGWTGIFEPKDTAPRRGGTTATVTDMRDAILRRSASPKNLDLYADNLDRRVGYDA